MPMLNSNDIVLYINDLISAVSRALGMFLLTFEAFTGITRVTRIQL